MAQSTTQMLRSAIRSLRARRQTNQHRAKHSRRRLALEPLEGRQMLAVLTVNSLLDNTTSGDGLVTLREAIAAANNNTATDLGHMGSGADTIQFAESLNGAVNLSTIGDAMVGASALLVTSPITIRGNSHGITLQRAVDAPEMRHFRVTASGSLTLDTIMVTGGVVRGANGAGPGQPGQAALGGAIFNGGTLEIRYCPTTVLPEKIPA